MDAQCTDLWLIVTPIHHRHWNLFMLCVLPLPSFFRCPSAQNTYASYRSIAPRHRPIEALNLNRVSWYLLFPSSPQPPDVLCPLHWNTLVRHIILTRHSQTLAERPRSAYHARNAQAYRQVITRQRLTSLPLVVRLCVSQIYSHKPLIQFVSLTLCDFVRVLYPWFSSKPESKVP